MEETYYRKVGRRYVPVSYYDSNIIDSLGEGTHLVVKTPGSSMIKHRIDPAFAPMIAAGIYARDKVCDAIFTASKVRPKSELITEEQRRAWRQLEKACADEFYYISYPSASDINDAAVAAMSEEVNKLLENPSVRNAYDHFMLMCKLAAKENSND